MVHHRWLIKIDSIVILKRNGRDAADEIYATGYQAPVLSLVYLEDLDMTYIHCKKKFRYFNQSVGYLNCMPI